MRKYSILQLLKLKNFLLHLCSLKKVNSMSVICQGPSILKNKCVRKLKWRLRKLIINFLGARKKNELLSAVQRKNLSLSKEIKEVRKENVNISLALIKKNKKLSKLNPRNINKRLTARDDTIKKLKAKISSKDKELADQKKQTCPFLND